MGYARVGVSQDFDHLIIRQPAEVIVEFANGREILGHDQFVHALAHARDSIFGTDRNGANRAQGTQLLADRFRGRHECLAGGHTVINENHGLAHKARQRVSMPVKLNPPA